MGDPTSFTARMLYSAPPSLRPQFLMPTRLEPRTWPPRSPRSDSTAHVTNRPLVAFYAPAIKQRFVLPQGGVTRKRVAAHQVMRRRVRGAGGRWPRHFASGGACSSQDVYASEWASASSSSFTTTSFGNQASVNQAFVDQVFVDQIFVDQRSLTSRSSIEAFPHLQTIGL